MLPSQALVEARALERAREAIEAGDWEGSYQSAKFWRARGGALSPGAWLVDVVSALHRRQPKTAVHVTDMALEFWLSEPKHRAIMHWARGEVIHLWMSDPATAIHDLEQAAVEGAAWLAPLATTAERAAREAATTRRPRKPRAGAAPVFRVPPPGGGPSEADRRRAVHPEADAVPPLWELTSGVINRGPQT